MTISWLRWGFVALVFLSACSSQPKPGEESSRFDRLFTKGQAYLVRGNPQMALVSLRKAQKLRPNHAVLLSQLGMAYDQVGQSGQALMAWRKAHNLNPASGAISHNLGVAMMRQQLLDEAKVAFLEALEDPKFDDRGETFYNLALIQQRRGAVREMVLGLEQVLKIDPNHIPAHQQLADYYRKMHRSDLEERHLRNILAFQSENVAILERLSDLYLQSGQPGKALPLLEHIQTVAPQSEAAKRAKLKQGHVLGKE
jgi:Tfp pilus assembly protein PilF